LSIEEESEPRRTIEQEIQTESEETTMPVFNQRETEGQQDRSLIPEAVYKFRLEIQPGNAGDGGWLKAAKTNLRLLMLATVNTVVAGDHTKRKVWDYTSVDFDESEHPDLPVLERDKLDGYRESVRIGRNKIRAMIDSALGLMPNDHSEEAEAARDAALESWEKLDGLTFWAQTRNLPASNGYKPKTVIDYIITPDLPDYPKQSKAVTAPAPASAQASLKDELDDEVPFVLAFFIVSAVAWLTAGGSALVA
jgi:hypothetical protein